MRRFVVHAALTLAFVVLSPPPAAAQPFIVLDLADPASMDQARRVRGATGTGAFGVPVAGGFDADGDGFVDYAVAYMTADPLGRTNAGEVDLVFGDGTLTGEVDTAVDQARVLRIYGDQPSETAGSEIWMSDVTGDGLGDLLICRQNFSPAGRSGAGALTIIAGGAALRTFAMGLSPLDLRSAPPAGVAITHVVGAATGDRFCIWARTGDVTGDGIDDLVVGADQQNAGGGTHSGGVYVLMGGAHLAAGGTLELSSGALQGKLTHVTAPAGSSHHHIGATCQVADLDDNGVAEVLAAATLNRAGAVLGPAGGPAAHGSGGTADGALHILWDDNFTPPWPAVFSFTFNSPPGSRTFIRGETRNVNFGEELLGGLDYDMDGQADLFVGDLVGDATPLQNRPVSGVGYVFYAAAGLKNLVIDMDSPPQTLEFTTILGPNASAIGADTAAQGDFDGDGVGDLVFCSPKGAPQGRVNAGTVHVLLGQAGGWPALIDTAALPDSGQVRIVEIQGARGLAGGDQGDILCYSAAAGDADGDGVTDLFVNEMEGNGTSAVDVGNLLVINGAELFSFFRDSFESGGLTTWPITVP